jgi:hypothetical protein
VSPEWDRVTARRLERSSLQPRGADLLEVVRGAGGIHAQVQASAELQLAARVDGLTQGEVRAALWDERVLVKAWTIRGTLHLHAADELALWLAARRALRTDDGIPEWRDPQGVLHPALTARETDEAREAVWDALDGRSLTRDELARAVKGKKVRSRLRSGFAFLTGELVQGPPQGTRITLARPDQWVDGWRDVEPRVALSEVCRRFLHAHGPARPSAFREWFGAPDAESLVAEVGEELETGWFVLPGDRRLPALESSVRLLPEYDVYVMGFREREQLVPERVRGLVAAHGRGKYEGPAGVRFVLVDGVASGLWERKRRGKRIELRVDLARRVARRAIAAEAERIGAFLGLEPVLSFRDGA